MKMRKIITFLLVTAFVINMVGINVVKAQDSFQNQIVVEMVDIDSSETTSAIYSEKIAEYNMLRNAQSSEIAPVAISAFDESITITDLVIGQAEPIEGITDTITFNVENIDLYVSEDYFPDDEFGITNNENDENYDSAMNHESYNNLSDDNLHDQSEEQQIINSPLPQNSIVMAAAAAPDYLISSLTYDSSKAYPFTALGTANFSITVKNNGGDTPSNTNIRCAIHVDGSLIGNFYLGSLPANSNASFYMSIDGIPEGTHAVKFTINDNYAISESNTSNNSLSANFNWTGKPDLTVASLTCTTSSPTVGSSVTFQYQISNIGNGKASGTFQTDVRVDGALIGTIPITNLDAGYTASGSFQISFPTRKTYTITMNADCNKNITESNENNNTKTYSLTTLKIAPTITVRGALRYRVYNNASGTFTHEFLKNYPIKIYDAADQSLKAATTTDNNGAFSVQISNNSANDGCNVYFVIKMESNSYARIMSLSASNIVYTFESDIAYKWQEPVLDFGTMTTDGGPEIIGVMNIYHWIKKGKDFYTSMTSMGNAGVADVRWEPMSTEGSHVTADGVIYIDGDQTADQYDADIILHEYGHYIMRISGRMPNIVGGKHSWDKPSTGDTSVPTTQDGTAFSEAYAHFISTQVRNSQTVYDYELSGGFFGSNLATMELRDYGKVSIVQRIPEFYHNARMELFTAGAMHKLASVYGFNGVNNVAMSSTRSSSIDFYDAFMAGNVSKITNWKYFDDYHSAFDYEMPRVTIIDGGGSTRVFTADASDNVGINKIEWYLDGVLKGTANSFSFPANTSVGVHALECRAYDYEGNVRGYLIRKDITGKKTLRTEAYDSDDIPVFVDFTSRAAQSGILSSDLFLNDIPDKLPEHSFYSDNMLVTSNLGGDLNIMSDTASMNRLRDSKSSDIIKVRNDAIAIDSDTDLYLTGNVFGAIDSIDVIDKNGQIAASIHSLYAAEYSVISDLPSGEYVLEVHPIDKEHTVPFRVVALAVPSKPELELPEYSAENSIKVNNPYANTLVIELNGKQYKIQPNDSIDIMLAEGNNDITYYSENNGSTSESVEGTVFVDSIAPVVIIERVEQRGGELIVSGTISEYAGSFTINGDAVLLGEFNLPGQPIHFGYRTLDTAIEMLNIEAVDYLGKSFYNQVKLIK